VPIQHADEPVEFPPPVIPDPLAQGLQNQWQGVPLVQATDVEEPPDKGRSRVARGVAEVQATCRLFCTGDAAKRLVNQLPAAVFGPEVRMSCKDLDQGEMVLSLDTVLHRWSPPTREEILTLADTESTRVASQRAHVASAAYEHRESRRTRLCVRIRSVRFAAFAIARQGPGVVCHGTER